MYWQVAETENWKCNFHSELEHNMEANYQIECTGKPVNCKRRSFFWKLITWTDA